MEWDNPLNKEPVMDARPSILIEEKTVWGKPMLYPVCDLSKMFCALAKTETLTPWMLQLIGGNDTEEDPGFFDIEEQLKGGYTIPWMGRATREPQSWWDGHAHT